MKYRAEVILSRTYGTIVVEADDENEAREIVTDMEYEDFDTAVDHSLDILEIYPEDEVA